MRTLSIDIETYSSIDLTETGVYKYVEAPDFVILMFAYAFGNDDVRIVDLAQGEEIPAEVFAALEDPEVSKKAHNANFERVCINAHFFINSPVNQWSCTMLKAAMLGLPFALDMVSKVLNLQQGKDAAGKALIRYFSIPCKPTKTNGFRTRNLPEHDIDKWNQFKKYCVQDVVVERTIGNKISFFEIPAQEKQLWYLDQRINDDGVLLDPKLITNAITIDQQYRERLTVEAIKITGLDNPNSGAQLKRWIGQETDTEVKKLTKDTVPVLLQSIDNVIVKRVLEIRQELAKTSVGKYETMMAAICADNRVRGLFQFCGANRTWRWAGRIVQAHNMPRIEKSFAKTLDIARALVHDCDSEMLEILFGNVSNALSQLIRTAFVAPKGHRFIVSDFSSIEAVIISWLAGEAWRMEVFRTHGKIYEASASQMFGVPIATITKDSPLRQRGKVSELALGYGGGPNALVTMGALKEGLKMDELPKLVKMWRNANRAIVALWATVEQAVIKCLQTKEPQRIQHGITFSFEKNILFIQLPSGRKLAYFRPKLKENRLVYFRFAKDHENYKADQNTMLRETIAEGYEKKGIGEMTGEPFIKQSITYEGMNQVTKQWGVQDTYGGKLVENIVQAIARDCLGVAMIRLDAADYKIVLHVHDEVVNEMPEDKGSVEEVNNIMSMPISWAKGLPLKAESYETTYYKKD